MGIGSPFPKLGRACTASYLKLRVTGSQQSEKGKILPKVSFEEQVTPGAFLSIILKVLFGTRGGRGVGVLD